MSNKLKRPISFHSTPVYKPTPILDTIEIILSIILGVSAFITIIVYLIRKTGGK